jgi:hypothetical protein
MTPCIPRGMDGSRRARAMGWPSVFLQGVIGVLEAA